MDAIDLARSAALQVLLNNRTGPYGDLPRTAAWGYPETYTRDLMIASLGFLASGDARLVEDLGRVLQALAAAQTSLGQVPSLAQDPLDLGASDTTPWFLIGLAWYRQATGDPDFLQGHAEKALTYLRYQWRDGIPLLDQQPTTDWRDEQWVLGFGLYVNVLVYMVLRLYGLTAEAAALAEVFSNPDIRRKHGTVHTHEGFAIADKPYFALWTYKLYRIERFDALGNSLAILSGLATPERALAIVAWVEAECEVLRERGELAGILPPALIPYIREGDIDWYPRLQAYNPPGAYHNGGVWPFVTGFYIAALVAAGQTALANEKLRALTRLVRQAHDPGLPYGFNEWYQAQDYLPRGQDWQTWSAALYLYASTAVLSGHTPLFDQIRMTDSPPPAL